MKPIAALATALMALSTPAFAQDAGAPGATGTTGPMTGSNTGTGYAPYYGAAPNGGYYAPAPNDYRQGYAYGPPVEGPYDGPGPYYGPGPIYGPGVIEGRAAAPWDFTGPNPRTVRGDQNGQDRAQDGEW